MPDKLLIRLINTATGTLSFDWALITAAGVARAGTAADFDQELKSLAAVVQSVIVTVPGQDVFLTSAKFPKLSPARLAKAIPFALEDQLTEEPTDLHFAVATVPVGQLVPIAVINKNKMLAWQSYLALHLKELATQVKVMLPDMLAMPWQANTGEIVLENDFAYVRMQKFAGFVIEKTQLFPMLQLVLNKPNVIKPASLAIYTASDQPLLTPEQMALLGMQAQHHALPSTGLLGMMAQVKEGDYPITLLQGDFAPAHAKITMNQWIWLCFALVGAWLFVLTISNAASLLILQRERSALTNQMQHIYAQLYPAKGEQPVNPKVSLENELNKLRSSRADSALIRLLYMVGPTLAPLVESGLSLKTLSYRNNQLVLDVEANDLSTTETLHQSLEAQGLKVVVSNAERSSTGLYQTRLTIEEIS